MKYILWGKYVKQMELRRTKDKENHHLNDAEKRSRKKN